MDYYTIGVLTENDIVCWHYDHSSDRQVKGVNFLTALYHSYSQWAKDISIPVGFALVAKTEVYIDKKDGKEKRRSPISKLEGVGFPLLLVKQVFVNEDGNRDILYLMTSDTTLTTMTYDGIITIYRKRWNVETYHKLLKQNASLEKSPTQTVATQTNHFFAALCAYIKLKMLRLSTKLNHFALKAKLLVLSLIETYVNALQVAFSTLREVQPVRFAA